MFVFLTFIFFAHFSIEVFLNFLYYVLLVANISIPICYWSLALLICLCAICMFPKWNFKKFTFNYKKKLTLSIENGNVLKICNIVSF